MVSTRFSFPIACILLSLAATAQGQYKPVQATQAAKGVYRVYDPNDNTTVHVRNVAAYIKNKYPPLQGFGKKLSPTEFAEGANPVAEAAQTAGNVVNNTAGAAYNVANRIPAWRRYTLPLKALLGTPNSTR